MICDLCPRKCGAERNERIGFGFCKMPSQPVLARASKHIWEEPCIAGEGGAGAVFFSGCTLKCCFCQNFEISHFNKGKKISVLRLAEIFRELEDEGCSSIDLVNPTHFSDSIISAFELYKPSIPIVYNSSGYDSISTLKRFERIVDVYLPDIKYFDTAVSVKYAACPDYFEKASAALIEMKRQTGECEFENGLMTKGLLVRHLVLPSNINDSKKILWWIKNNLGADTFVSLMSQYTPFAEAEKHKEINRRLFTAEYDKVVNYFFEIGLKNGFMQEKTSASTDFIPKFDNFGV